MAMTLKRIISCLIVICLTCTILIGLTNLTEEKSSLSKYMQFFEQEADFDVLFLGSSKMINGILPMELWNDYGIVSYNLGGHSNTIPTSYWVLRNALDYTRPKYVVLDCFGSDWSGRISDNFYYTHLSFDAFPLSATKIHAVCDLINPEKVENGMAKRMELLWNFSTYHSRWNELTTNDFHPYFTYQKGAEPRVNVSIPGTMAQVSPDLKNDPDTNGVKYLIKTIELCRQRGIDVILINLPFPADESVLIAANTVSDVAKAYDVEYLNFFTMDTVDYQTDMYDPDSHLNPSGARKITDYMGQLLSQQYGIPDRRDNPEYQSWYEDAKQYRQEKVDLFENASSAWCWWMLLSDDDFSFLAELSQETLQQDPVLSALLQNAGIAPEKITGHCVIAADRASGSVSYIPYDELLQAPVETSLGALSLAGDSIQLNGQDCWQIGQSDDRSAAIRLALLDTDNLPLKTAVFSPEEIRSEHAQ